MSQVAGCLSICGRRTGLSGPTDEVISSHKVEMGKAVKADVSM